MPPGTSRLPLQPLNSGPRQPPATSPAFGRPGAARRGSPTWPARSDSHSRRALLRRRRAIASWPRCLKQSSAPWCRMEVSTPSVRWPMVAWQRSGLSQRHLPWIRSRPSRCWPRPASAHCRFTGSLNDGDRLISHAFGRESGCLVQEARSEPTPKAPVDRPRSRRQHGWPCTGLLKAPIRSHNISWRRSPTDPISGISGLTAPPLRGSVRRYTVVSRRLHLPWEGRIRSHAPRQNLPFRF